MILVRKEHTVKYGSRGYTLVEVLLVTGLLMLFTTAAVITISPTRQDSELSQGAFRFESILRFARAEAANSGRRVRVNFVQDKTQSTNLLNQVHLTWEPKPLDEPEIFQDLPENQWGVDGVNANIGIETVRLLDINAPDTSGDCAQSAPSIDKIDLSPPVQPQCITFNPDGSSESAEIVLAARNTDNAQRMTVRIIGLDGTISRELAADEDSARITDSEEQPRERSLAEAP